jgi:hypothetical protein
MQLVCKMVAPYLGEETVDGKLVQQAGDPVLTAVGYFLDDQTVPDSALDEGAILLPYAGSLGPSDLIMRPVPDDAVDFSAVKAALSRRIDGTAEAIRLKLITPGSGQAMEYQEAYSQAQAALNATGTVKPADYPMLAATIGVDIDPDTGKPAKDVLGVARSVKAAYEGYLQAGAAIRGARLLGKAEVGAAVDVTTALAVFAAIKWPSFG